MSGNREYYGGQYSGRRGLGGRGSDHSSNRGRGGSQHSTGGERGISENYSGRGRGSYDRGDQRGRGGSEHYSGRGRGSYDGGDQRGRGSYHSSERGGSSYDRRGSAHRYNYRSGGDFRDRKPAEVFEFDNMFDPSEVVAPDISDNPVLEGMGSLYGDFGQAIKLSSNYVRVASLPNYSICQYHVSFEPEIENPRLRYRLLSDNKELVQNTFAFDGTMLYLTRKIDDCEFTTTTKLELEVKTIIKYVCNVSPGSPSSIPLFNIIMRRVMSMLKLKRIKRHFFDCDNKKELSSKSFYVYPGFAGTLCFYRDVPFYNIDVVNHVMRRESVYEYIRKAMEDTRIKKADIERSLVGQIITTRYNNRTYRIDSINFDLKPTCEFKLKNERSITYIEYYEKQYGLKIVDIEQPLIVSILKERRRKHEEKQAQQKGEERKHEDNIVHLIPEFSFLTGITDQIRSDYSAMKELSDFTKLGPTGRCNGAYRFLKCVRGSDEAAEYLSGWGVNLEEKLVSIPARQYPAEKITFSSDSKPVCPPIEEVDWTADLKDIKLYNPGCLRKWVVFRLKNNQDTVAYFIDILNRCCMNLGFHVNKPETVEIYHPSPNELAKSLKSIDGKGYELALFILPANRKDLYDTVKKNCCVDKPIPSQFITMKTLGREKVIKNIATKIAIQMSVKIGGEPWVVTIPSKFKMTVGIDVSHEPGTSRKHAWLGFTASLNCTQSRYFSRATRQPSGTEIADSLGQNFKLAIEQYFKLNNRLPDAIIVYRDGVGDGQLEMVKTHEIPSIQNVLADISQRLGGSPAPTLAYVIVRKRINTRLFTVRDNHAINPLPGSIVDRVILKDEYPNFYLVSQTVREGTVNPTHYIVTYNSTRLSTNNLQRLSYKLCHLYYNWSGTVRVPAPCQYAHKLCFLVSQSLGIEPSSVLSDRLFYL